MDPARFIRLQEASQLISEYSGSASIKEQVDTTLRYKQRNVFELISLLASFDDNYRRYYNVAFSRSSDSLGKRKPAWQLLPEQLDKFFNSCAQDQGARNRLLEVVTNPDPFGDAARKAEYDRMVRDQQAALSQGTDTLASYLPRGGGGKSTAGDQEYSVEDQAKIDPIKKRLSDALLRLEGIPEGNFEELEKELKRLVGEGYITPSEATELRKIRSVKGLSKEEREENLKKLAEEKFLTREETSVVTEEADRLKKESQRKKREEELYQAGMGGLMGSKPPEEPKPETAPTREKSPYPEQAIAEQMMEDEKKEAKLKAEAQEAAKVQASEAVKRAAEKAAKDAESKVGIQARRALARPNVASAAVGGIVGAVIGAGNGGVAGALAGAVAGAGAGAVASQAIQQVSNRQIPLVQPEQIGRSGRSSGGAASPPRITSSSLLKKWWVWVLIIILGIFLFPLIQNLINQTALCPPWQGCGTGQEQNACLTGGQSGSCPTKEQIAENRKDRNTCKGLSPNINIFDTSFSEGQIQNYVNTYYQQAKTSKEEFEQKVRYIVVQSGAAGLNPILPLAYWKTESLFGTYPGASDLGCAPGYKSQQGFEQQVKCALGIASGGSQTARCATSKDPNSEACKGEAGRIKGNPKIYDPYNIKIPIATFDDFAGMYGPFSPILGDAEQNNNCIATYNTMLEVAIDAGVCKATGDVTDTADLAACKFTKGDQNPKDLPFQSQLLLSYFKDVSRDTGIPATILAGIARVESTTGVYTISDYTDVEVKQMGNNGSVIGDIDSTIEGTKKALCPASPTGALGIMQVQPPPEILDRIRGRSPEQVARFNKSAYSADGLGLGAKLAGKSYESLTVKDFCDPKTSVYLAAGVILKKMQGLGFGDGTKWDPSWNSDKKYFDSVASSYYGCLKYPSCQSGPNSYGDDLWNSFNNCKGTPTSNIATSQVNLGGIPTSDKITVTCPLSGKNGSDNNTINCGTAANPVNGCGHGGIGYGACSAPPYAVCPYSAQLKKSIDVKPAKGGNAPVYAPFINGRDSIAWTKISGPIPINGGSWGYKVVYEASYLGRKLTLDLTHLNQRIAPTASVQSGEEIGTIYPNTDGDGVGHLHTALAIDGNWVEAEKEAGMCSPGASGYALTAQANQAKCACSQGSQNQQLNTGSSVAGGKGQVIVLDPGHCSNDKYGEKKIPENKLNTKTAETIAKLLNDNGYSAKIFNPTGDYSCSNEDYYGNLQQRVDFANDSKAAAYISVHADSGPQSDEFNPIYSAKGPFSEESQKLADLIGKSVSETFKSSGKVVPYKVTESTKTGIAQGDGLEYYVLGPKGAKTAGLFGGKITEIQNPRSMPGVIVENYLKTKPDYTDLFSSIDTVALGYCNGISKFLGGGDCKQTSQSPGSTNSCNPVIGGTAGGTFFCQSDPRWGNLNGAGTTCSLATGGCGPSTMAMVLARLGIGSIPNTDTWNGSSLKIPEEARGKEINPLSVDSIYGANRFRTCATQSPDAYLGGFKGAKVLDSTISFGAPSEERLKELKQITDTGGVIIGSVNAYPLSSGGTVGHIFGISGVDFENKKFKMFDPAKCRANPTDPDTEVGFDTVLGWSWFYNAGIIKK